MDLLQRTTDIVGDEDRATNALGTVFMAIRLAMNEDRFRAVQTALPEVDLWVKQAVSGNAARTGEVLAILDPSSITGRLHKAGVTDEQIPELGSAVYEALGEALERDALDTLALRFPLLSGAPA